MDSMADKAHELRDSATAAAADVGSRLSSTLHSAADAVDKAAPDAPATTTAPTATATTTTAADPTLTSSLPVAGAAFGGPVATHSAPTPPVADVAADSDVHGGSHAAALLGDTVSPSEAAADLSTPEAKEAKVRVNAAAKAALGKVAGGISAAADSIASAAEVVEAKAADVSARADTQAAEHADASRQVSAKADAMAADAEASGEAVAVKAQAKADEFAAKAQNAVDTAEDKVENAAQAVKETVAADVEVDRTASAPAPAGAQITSISDAIAATQAAEESRKL
ncbi:hypothetical protein MMPV_004573 [Pyropia vietnamensis]